MIKDMVKEEAIRIKRLLTVSEEDIMKEVYKELNGKNTGIVTVSKVCDNLRLTRSSAKVILSKLEFASILTTKSMGMKGLHITVLKPEVFNEICK